MKVAVVGLGSMGQRRTRLIKQYDSSIEVFGIDTMPERCAECQEKYGMKTFRVHSRPRRGGTGGVLYFYQHGTSFA